MIFLYILKGLAGGMPVLQLIFGLFRKIKTDKSCSIQIKNNTMKLRLDFLQYYLYCGKCTGTSHTVVEPGVENEYQFKSPSGSLYGTAGLIVFKTEHIHTSRIPL